MFTSRFREKAIGNRFRENGTLFAIERARLPAAVPFDLPNRERPKVLLALCDLKRTNQKLLICVIKLQAGADECVTY